MITTQHLSTAAMLLENRFPKPISSLLCSAPSLNWSINHEDLLEFENCFNNRAGRQPSHLNLGPYKEQGNHQTPPTRPQMKKY